MDKTRAPEPQRRMPERRCPADYPRQRIDPAGYEGAIIVTGTAQGLAPESMVEQPEPIMQEKAVVQGVSGPALVQYVLPESDLSMDASGTETLNNIRDLFETAIQPEDREQLAALFRLATELAEVQNLLDRIEQTPEGKDLSESPTG